MRTEALRDAIASDIPQAYAGGETAPLEIDDDLTKRDAWMFGATDRCGDHAAGHRDRACWLSAPGTDRGRAVALRLAADDVREPLAENKQMPLVVARLGRERANSRHGLGAVPMRLESRRERPVAIDASGACPR